MEGNGYFMPLRNSRRYTPYEFDLKMSQNEDRMNRLGKIIDQDIYYTLMSNRKKTPLVSGQNYVVENNKEYKPLNQNLNSINFNIKNDTMQKNNLMEISNNSFKIPRSPRYINSNQMRQFREPEKEFMNDEGRYGNYNPNERYMNNMNDEQINLYPKRNNNDFNNYNMNNQYPKIMDNENTLRNKNIALRKVQVARKLLRVGHDGPHAARRPDAEEHDDDERDGHENALDQVCRGDREETAHNRVGNDDDCTENHRRMVLNAEQAVEERADGLEARSGIGNEENDDGQSRDAGEHMPLVTVAA